MAKGSRALLTQKSRPGEHEALAANYDTYGKKRVFSLFNIDHRVSLTESREQEWKSPKERPPDAKPLARPLLG